MLNIIPPYIHVRVHMRCVKIEVVLLSYLFVDNVMFDKK